MLNIWLFLQVEFQDLVQTSFTDLNFACVMNSGLSVALTYCPTSQKDCDWTFLGWATFIVASHPPQSNLGVNL